MFSYINVSKFYSLSTASFQGPSNSASPSSVSSLLNTPVREPPTQVRSLPNTQTDDKGVMWLSENMLPLQTDHKVGCKLQFKSCSSKMNNVCFDDRKHVKEKFYYLIFKTYVVGIH